MSLEKAIAAGARAGAAAGSGTPIWPTSMCRESDCGRPVANALTGGLCRFHSILMDAANLRDQADLDALIAALPGVHLITDEERAERKRQTWLDMVNRSMKEMRDYRARAIKAGATPAQIAQVTAAFHAALDAPHE